jgi:hypothetical protein
LIVESTSRAAGRRGLSLNEQTMNDLAMMAAVFGALAAVWNAAALWSMRCSRCGHKVRRKHASGAARQGARR